MGCDRRVELVQLFGLLRSDGIFPSAVTLGQYTRAIAEGFSKRSSIISDAEIDKITSNDVRNNNEGFENVDLRDTIHSFDKNIEELETWGRRWRGKRDTTRKKVESKINKGDAREHKENLDYTTPLASTFDNLKKSQSKRSQKEWFPVMLSSSLSSYCSLSKNDHEASLRKKFNFVSLWSRTTDCSACSYIPLDEEIQSGWDEIDEGNEVDNSNRLSPVPCPCCGAILFPQLGYSERNLDYILNEKGDNTRSKDQLPPQAEHFILNPQHRQDASGYVPYLNPSVLRNALERHVEEQGEEVLERERLRILDPAIFYNLWWLCARFSVPLPLTISLPSTESKKKDNSHECNWYACVSWDKSVADEGCLSIATSINSYILTKSRKDPNSRIILPEDSKPSLPIFNLQSYTERDWDHPELSQILIMLVEACDKGNFNSVVNCVLQCNQNRRARLGDEPGVELDCYRTLLYLTRYQCTNAFHRFFPSTTKGCRGYHFWCKNATYTIFDRMFRDAVEQFKISSNGPIPALHNVSDVALGFRNVFGHII